jgi:hypothetical protein
MSTCSRELSWKDLNREDGQRRRRERVRIYGEIAQPRSHLLEERLITFAIPY